MRGTVHLFSRRDALALRPRTAQMLATRFGSTGFAKNLDEVAVAEVGRVARTLAPAAPLSRAELGRRLAEHFPGAPADSLAYAAVFHEPMAQTPPRGVWGMRGTPKWQTFQGFLGVSADGTGVVDDVVVRYLAAFGPASVADIRYWSRFSGLREVVDRLRPRLRAFVDRDLRATWKLNVVGDSATITVAATPKLNRRESDDVRVEGLRLLEVLAPGATADARVVI